MQNEIIKNNKGIIWKKTIIKASNGTFKYKSNCFDCNIDLLVMKYKVKTHGNLCRKCHMKKVRSSYVEGEIIRRANEKIAAEKAEEKRLKQIKLLKEAKTKVKTLGQRVIQFDNSRNNTVAEFNRIFKANLDLNPRLEVIIGKPFTHYGRHIYVNGVEYNHLFEVN